MPLKACPVNGGCSRSRAPSANKDYRLGVNKSRFIAHRLSRTRRPLLLTFRIEALEVAEIAHHFGAAIHPERLSFFGLEQFEMLQHDASREEDFELAGRKIEIHLDHFVGLRTLVIAKEDFVMLSPDLRGARIDPILAAHHRAGEERRIEDLIQTEHILPELLLLEPDRQQLALPHPLAPRHLIFKERA